MKLTTEMLKKMIMEELEGAAPTEEPAEEEAAPKAAAPGEAPAKPNAADAQKAKTNSTSKLKAEFVELSRNITKIPGLDPNELNLISGMMASMIKIASSGSGTTIMKRVYDVLQKHIK